MNLKQLKLLLISGLIAGSIFSASAETSLSLSSTSAAVSENFDSMWDADNSSASLTLPDGWRIDRNLDAPRTIGKWSDASTTLMYSGGVSLASNAKNGTWNFGSSANSSDRAIGGLSTTVSNGTRCVNLMTQIDNVDASQIITHLNVSYNVEKYRKGANTAGYAVQMYYSTDGKSWESCGEDFKTSFAADSETLGAEIVPIETVSVSEKSLRTHIEAGNPIYLAWNISVASGSTPDKAMALAIDDIVINATFAETDDDWVEVEKPEMNPSGIYLRGVAGWTASSDWEFSDEGDGVYVLYNKEISGTFKIGDSSWSLACNYGSNGSNIVADIPYTMVANSQTNISCGANTYLCKRVVLTIVDGVATLLLETNDDATGLTDVYMVGDMNDWDYMDASCALHLDSEDNLFKGKVTMKASSDGYCHWRIYQRLGMGGAWGAADDMEVNALAGTLVAKSTNNVATAPGTYNVTFDLATGAFTLTQLEASIVEMTLNPADVVLVKDIPEQVKMLSLNNSLIYYNDQDAIFNDLAEAMGKDAHWTKHTLLGKSLATHWAEGDGLTADNNPGAKMLVRSDTWSHIILQEQSSLPRTDFEQFRNNVKQWVEYIREYCPNPNAVIILPVNWAYNTEYESYSTFNTAFLNNYVAVAREFGLTICPVGKAYEQVYEEEGAEGANTWFLDDRHPTVKSSYMAACMEYGLLYGEDPLTINSHPSDITDEVAAEMRRYASEALSSFSNDINQTAGTVNYTVALVDEFGLEHADENTTLTVSGGGEMNGNQFVSDGTEGVYTVTATNGEFTKTATITVTHAETEMETFPAICLNRDNLRASENFNSIGTSETAELPEGWRIDRQTSDARVVGTYSAAQTATMYAGGENLASNAKNGTWNFGATDSADRALGGITTGIANGSRAINVYVHLYNDGTKNLENINISYDVEKYRKGSNAAGFTVQMYQSIDGAHWTSCGDDFKTVFAADSETAGYDVVPGETVSVSNQLPGTFGKGCDLYLAWNISVTSGSACAQAPALAIDNFEISTSLPPVPVYDNYIYVEDQTGWDSLGAYAWATGLDELFGAWPGQAPIDEQEIDGTLFKVFGHNDNEHTYNLIFNNWNNGKQLADYTIVGGKDYYFTITSEGVTVREMTAVETIQSDATEMSIRVSADEVESLGAESIMLFASNGICVKRGVSTLSLEGVPAGIYIVRAVARDASAVCKIRR